MRSTGGRGAPGTPWRRWGLVVLGTIVVAGCASVDGSATDPTTPAGTGDGASEQRFCRDWEAARRSGDTAAIESLAASAPPAIERTDPTARAALGEIDAACHPAMGTTAATADDRRIAPPFGATPAGLTPCSAGPTIGAEWNGLPDGGVVLYGDGALADPYEGAMLGLIWATEEEGFGGDGPRTPVVVAGNAGLAGPITVFQQVVLPELGTQVEWSDGEVVVALIGRGWPPDRLTELVALAGSVEVVDGPARLPDAARPAGMVEVFAGRPLDLALVVDPTTDYEVHYRPDGGRDSVTLSGFVATEDEFEAVRFLTLGLERSSDGGRTSLSGNAWFADSGPAVVTWREPDGAVVRVVDMGTEPAHAAAIAGATRDLSPNEWAELASRSGSCPDVVPPELPSAGPEGTHG